MMTAARSRFVPAILFALLPATAALGQVRIVQTNSAGDNIHLIDPATNTVVGEITGVPINHGAAAAPDGRVLYFSSEGKRTLEVVDVPSLKLTKSIPLSGRPNNIFINRDGSLVYVAIVSAPGAVDVIDTKSLERVRSISTNGGIHNVYLTPDGRHLVAGSIAGRHLEVFDARTEERLWSLFDVGVRPMTFETNPDGSTRRMFVELSDFHGFAIVDFQGQKEVGRVSLPSDIPPERVDPGPYNAAPAHGIGVAPDGKTLWVCSRPNGRVYAYALPDLTLLGGVDVGKRPDWLTFTPDSTRVYVATESTNSVSVVDVASRREVTRIPVGKAPKRNIAITIR
jgi:YVTN family beta-propeller protein